MYYTTVVHMHLGQDSTGTRPSGEAFRRAAFAMGEAAIPAWRDHVRLIVADEGWRLYFVHEVKSVGFRILDWAQRVVSPDVLRPGGGVLAYPEPQSLPRARWMEVSASATATNNRFEGRDRNKYPVLCNTCGWPDLDRVPTPYLLPKEVLRGVKSDMFLEELNGILVVTREARQLLVRYVGEEVDVGEAEVEGQPSSRGQFFWVRPKNVLQGQPGRVDAGYLCPACGWPDGERLDASLLSPGVCGMWMLRGNGPQEWNIARVASKRQVGADEWKRGQPYWVDVVISGGLYAALVNAGVRGLHVPESVYISAEEEERTYEEERRFAHELSAGIDKVTRGKARTTPYEKVLQQRGGSALLYQRDAKETVLPKKVKTVKPSRDLNESITHYIQQHIGPVATVFHELVPMADVHIDIHLVNPTRERPFYTLVTSGMAEKSMMMPSSVSPRDATPYVELMLALPQEWRFDQLDEPRWNWPLQWLHLLAWYPHRYKRFLYFMHTVPNGEPPEAFSSDTEMCCWFMRTPLTLPSEARGLQLGEKVILFMAPTPIYRSEMEFALKGSVWEQRLALDDALAEAGVTEVVNVNRRAVR